MESAGIFIWRVRLCVLLAVAGQSFVDFGKHTTNAQHQQIAQKTAQHVKCAADPRAGAAANRDARSKLDCGPVATHSTPLKTGGDHRVVLPPDAASMKSTHWSVR
jgi:hypothetical protein